MRHGNASSTQQAGSTNRRGSSNNMDALSRVMSRHGVPVNRKNYLDLAHLGQAPRVLSPEEEQELPPNLRRGQPQMSDEEPKQEPRQELSEQEAFDRHRERQKMPLQQRKHPPKKPQQDDKS